MWQTVLFLLIATLQLPRFEVVSIKRNDSGIAHMIVGGPGGCHGTDDQNKSGLAIGRCLFRNISTRELINLVFGVTSQTEVRILNEPKWLNDDRFDIEGKSEGPVEQKQLLLMLQDALATRFKMTSHYEARDVDGFVLLINRGGPKLSKAADPHMRETAALAVDTKQETYRLTGHNLSLAGLVSKLEHGAGPDSRYALGKPVADKTGLSGTYDFVLSWSDSTGPSLVTALQEQLGLRVQPQKVQVQTLVIDQIDRPTPN
jgi:uncharacterized protein (TIGR03435 family)